MWGDPTGASELREQLDEERGRVIKLAIRTARLRGLLERVVESRVEGEERYPGEAVIVLYEDDWLRIRQALVEGGDR